nr:hypothetical protein [uncultured Methanoregula sp.]
MTYSAVLTPLAVVLELVLFLMGVYAGYFRKKTFGYCFAATFLIFAVFDVLGSTGVSSDILSILNIIAILASVTGMYLVIREKM